MDTLKMGAHGLAVSSLQQMLNAAGASLVVDGWFGDATADAVAAYQQRIGLVVDGVAGPKTLQVLAAGSKPAGMLGAADLQAAAEKLDVSVAAIRAVNEVESAGAGFLPDGRCKVLFERHVMHQRLQAAGADVAALAARYPLLINPQRGGYAGGAAEWQRLTNAGLVSGYPDLAVEAASWGAFQIMGYHWQRLGYASAAEFEAAMQDSEAGQLDGFMRFIAADPVLLKALRTRKWADFAHGYNGPAYAANLYDVKLARAYERYASQAEAVAA
ncbi:Peptidoglycan-binding (PGRP) domain of peptidoglycan hydrolases-containing protein [Andreprevotia lacus DSM 23236]|jgi:hypothetical protein|uniref:Peptidoglycan-binding (PGRP) domain of peptidoglycan hydrolases-containing protein n=1 Tax=Andreprevotia lacus DSM 23236 TaxID=1121001 RepID=A0A1W1XJS8_9NEIS|nr:N-acetylmuramidase family protein [Andreprevotia lacus]SMC24205.1 Peptidoglycan-binding (PGRP) domain of peptidoglycan hydrolases-containing protein [Andreprevotia lacus DSM 23236]